MNKNQTRLGDLPEGTLYEFVHPALGPGLGFVWLTDGSQVVSAATYTYDTATYESRTHDADTAVTPIARTATIEALDTAAYTTGWTEDLATFNRKYLVLQIFLKQTR